MKAKTTVSVAVVALLLSGLMLRAEDNNEDWMSKHAVIKTTETTQRNANGDVQSIKLVNETIIYIKQTSTEIQKPDAKGMIRTTSKTTTSLDTLGGSATVVESLLPGTSKLVTTSITTVEKTPQGTVTTVYARDKGGNMNVISQTTSIIKNNGTAPTVTLP